jgi:hypothetical protein
MVAVLAPARRVRSRRTGRQADGRTMDWRYALRRVTKRNWSESRKVEDGVDMDISLPFGTGLLRCYCNLTAGDYADGGEKWKVMRWLRARRGGGRTKGLCLDLKCRQHKFGGGQTESCREKKEVYTELSLDLRRSVGTWWTTSPQTLDCEESVSPRPEHIANSITLGDSTDCLSHTVPCMIDNFGSV